jgi:hypothetical protein
VPGSPVGGSGQAGGGGGGLGAAANVREIRIHWTLTLAAAHRQPRKLYRYALQCAYGSVGALGEQSPRATWPFFHIIVEIKISLNKLTGD